MSPVRPSWGLCHSCQFPLGFPPRCCPNWPLVTIGVTLGGGSQHLQILYTPVAPIIHEVELGSFFLLQPCRSPPLPFGRPRLSLLYFWTSLCCTYVQSIRSGRGRVFTLSFGFPSIVLLHSGLFKGTRTEIGTVLRFPSTLVLLFLLTHLLCILRPLLCLTRTPPFIFQLLSPLSE